LLLMLFLFALLLSSFAVLAPFCHSLFC
jgi:hypothetical protein